MGISNTFERALVSGIAGAAVIAALSGCGQGVTGPAPASVRLLPPQRPSPPPRQPSKPGAALCHPRGAAVTGLPLGRPLAVMVENHPAARPQSGLSEADTVYEVLAEGGITRFLAIFRVDNAPVIGPIRSAR